MSDDELKKEGLVLPLFEEIKPVMPSFNPFTFGRTNISSSEFRISNLRIRNVKSVEEASVTFSDLNIFLGSNSAGKSTLLQALAFLSQNSQNYGRGDLMLNGTAVRLGNYSEFYRRSGSDPVEIEVELMNESSTAPPILDKKTSPSKIRISGKFVLGPNQKNPGVCDILSATLVLDREGETDQMGWTASQDWDFSEWNFRAVQFSDKDGKGIGVFDESKSPIDLYPSYILRKQKFGSWLAGNFAGGPLRIQDPKMLANPDERLQKLVTKLVESHLSTLNYLVSEFGSDPDAVQIHFARHLRDSHLPIEIRAMRRGKFSQDAFVDAIDQAILDSNFPKGLMYLPELQPRSIQGELAVCGQKFSEVIRNRVHYLGPLRIEPAGIHRQDSTPHPIVPVGIRGEYSSYQLHYGPFSTKLDTYPVPPGQKVSKVTLLTAVENWFRWLELGRKVSIREEGQSGLVTKTDGESLYQKGTGVSQILPVVVISLLANAGSTVLIEQPELHLHPALQQKLGNFFVELAKSGRNFVIETHSEYLITRLRKLVSVAGEKSDSINIYFATKSASALSTTEYLKASIESTGDLSIWPDGFFDFAGDDEVEIMLNRIMDDEEPQEQGLK